VGLAVHAGPPRELQGALEVVEIPVNHRHVAERGRHILRLADPRQLRVGPLVQRERLVEPILPIEDVADVAIEARQPEEIPVTFEDGPCLYRRCERVVVAAEGNQALQRAVDGARDVHLVAAPLEQRPCRVVVLQRDVVLSEAERHVAQRPLTLATGGIVLDLVGQPSGRPGEPLGLPQVGSRQPHHFRVQPLDEVGAPELAMPAQQGRAGRGGGTA
jgi:hypothetical protein